MDLSDTLTGEKGREPTSIDRDLWGFRRDAHKQVLGVAAAMCWISFIDACRLDQASEWPFATSALLGTGILLSLLLRVLGWRHAPVVLAGALAGAYCTTVLAYPLRLSPYLSVLVLLLCYGMLPSWQSGVLALAMLGGLAAAHWAAPVASAGWPVIVGVAVLLVLTLATSWLWRRQLVLALAWAGQSTARAQRLNDALRDRQFVLNRALRAMDEANERLAAANTRLVEARRAADEARQAKARFAANISHELRTPLNLILGFVELMYCTPQAYRGVVLSPDFLVDLGAVYRNAQHLQRLVDDVLDLSQIDSGKVVMELVEGNLTSTVEEAVEIMQSLATARGLAVTTNIAPDLPRLRFDPTRIRQVVLNILSNAVRYTERGSVTVTLGLDGEEVICAVADTGPGISEERQNRIFEEFERAGPAGSPGRRGFGLGLAISERFVRAHGGRIWVESRLGEGSTFSFSLPIPQADAFPIVGTRLRQSAEIAEAELHRDPVVMISPSLVAARFFSRHLRGLRCVASRDVRQTIRQITDLQPRGVLIDAALDESTVDQVCRTAQAVAIRNLPIIVCSMPSESQTPALAGIKAYLTKPVTRQDLLDTLRTMGGRVETVLVVDDEEDVLRLFTHYLQDNVARPYKVLTARDGREALAVMKETPPDLVFLDLLLPVMDGYQLLSELRRIPDLAGIPVVAVSGQDLSDQQESIPGDLQMRMARKVGPGQLVEGVSALIRAMQAPG